MAHNYVHGYDAEAHARLHEQATALAPLLHPPHDEVIAPGSHVLEIGCGVAHKPRSSSHATPPSRSQP